MCLSWLSDRYKRQEIGYWFLCFVLNIFTQKYQKMWQHFYWVKFLSTKEKNPCGYSGFKWSLILLGCQNILHTYKNKYKKKPPVVGNNLFIIIIYGGHPVDTGAVADGMWYNHGGAGGLSLTWR